MSQRELSYHNRLPTGDEQRRVDDRYFARRPGKKAADGPDLADGNKLRDQSKGHRFEENRRRVVSYWGSKWEAGQYEDHDFRLGLRGRVWGVMMTRLVIDPSAETQTAFRIADMLVGSDQDYKDLFRNLRAACGDEFEAIDLGKGELPKVHKQKLAGPLRDLISQDYKGGYPPAACKNVLADVVVRWFGRELAQLVSAEREGRAVDATAKVDPAIKREVDAALAWALDTDDLELKTPSAVFRGLISRLGLAERLEAVLDMAPKNVEAAETGRKAGDNLHISPRTLGEASFVDRRCFQNVARARKGTEPFSYREPESRDAADDISTKIMNDLGRMGSKQLMIVHGEAYAGKRPKLARLLRLLAHDEAGGKGNLVLERRDAKGGVVARLPVLALCAKGLGYRMLVRRIISYLEFLEGICDGRGSGREVFLGDLSQQTVEDEDEYEFSERIERLKKLHEKHPVLFVISDIESYGHGASRNAVRDLGFKRLINSLVESNPHSVVLIAVPVDFDTLEQRDRNYIEAVLPMHEDYRVPPPAAMKLVHFVSDEGVRERLYQISHLVSGFTICGDAMVLLAALFNRGSHTGERRVDQVSATVRSFDHVFGCFRSLVRAPKDSDKRKQIRRKIFDLMVEEADEAGVLRPLALVAASIDGILDRTMWRAMDEWRKVDPAIEVPETPEELAELLGVFAQSTGRFFLQRKITQRFDEEEYGYEQRENYSSKDMVWELEDTLADGILEAIDRRDVAAAETHPDRGNIAREACRLVAMEAAWKGEQKKVMMRPFVPFRAGNECFRDIQAYMGLLASLPPGVYEPKVPLAERAALRRMSNRVFTVNPDEPKKPGDPKKFDAWTAFRYAVFCILRDGIDVGRRLALVSNEDELRLDLYLRLFQPLDTISIRKQEKLKFPEELPPHLQRDENSGDSLLTDDEMIELLVTVALAAYQAQRGDVLTAVARHADVLWHRLGRTDEVAARLVRIWVCQIDHQILHGFDPENDPIVNFAAIMKYAGKLIDERFSGDAEVMRVFNDPTFEGPVPQKAFAVIKARMRLMARVAEVSSHIDADRVATHKLYNEINRVEALLGSPHGIIEPLVQSGQTARVYIRFLVREPLLQDLEAKFLGAAGGPGSTPGAKPMMSPKQATNHARELIAVNVARLNRRSEGARVGIMLDYARLQFVNWDEDGKSGDPVDIGKHLDKALEYANEAHERAFNGKVPLGIKLESLSVRSDLFIIKAKWMFDAGRDGDVVFDELLEHARSSVKSMLAIAHAMRYFPTEAIARFLSAKLQFVELKSNFRHLRLGYEGIREGLRNAVLSELGEASSLMNKVGDITFATHIRSIQSEGQELLRLDDIELARRLKLRGAGLGRPKRT